MTPPPWSAESMRLAEQGRAALVTVIDDHVAIVLPHSLARTDNEAALAALLARLSRTLERALHK